MTIEELRAQAEYLAACLRDIHVRAESRSFTPDEQTSFDEGRALYDETLALIERHNDVARLGNVPAAVVSGNAPAFHAPNINTRASEDPFDLSELRFDTPVSEIRGRANDAIERVAHLDDHHKERATEVLRTADQADGRLARHMLATGSDAYRSAFQKLVGGEGFMLNADEQRAVEVARAASLTSANGGYAVPFTLDPTIIDTRNGYANPFRQISRVVSITTNSWNGVSSAGVTASWDAEAAEVSDDAPTLAQPSIPVYKGQAFVPFSVEIGGDWANIESDLRMMIANSKDDLEAATHATGTGSAQPTGIVTALAGGSSEVAPTTGESFSGPDIYKLENALGPRYRQRASWVANKAIYNMARQFDTAGGASLWVRLDAAQPSELIGYPAYEASAMDGTYDATATANNYVAILGDFQNFVIVDRVGMSVELVPHLFGSSRRPTGQRGFLAWWRSGSDSVNDAAFRMLNVATAA